MIKRRLRRFLRSRNTQGVSFFAVGTVLAAFLTATVVGVPFGAVVLAVTTFLSGAAVVMGVLAVFAPIIL